MATSIARRGTALFAALAALVGCEPPPSDDVGQLEQELSSNHATLLDFEFDGELVTTSTWASPTTQIHDQLLYTVGQLNGDNAVGRLARVDFTNVTSRRESDKARVKYHAKMTVAWGRKTNLPTTYTFRLPIDVSSPALVAFAQKYGATCVDFGAHDVDPGSMWYYFRPRASGCAIEPRDLLVTTATVVPSSSNTTGKYPEYDRVWNDGVLDVIAIFGKYEDGATTAADAGIAAYNAFVSATKTQFAAQALVTLPASIPSAPGITMPDITFRATLGEGKSVKITALLVDNVSSAGAAFNARYAALSPSADVIAYNGHAGIGQDMHALARLGRFVAGKYLIAFMNGDDTFAHDDGQLAQVRAVLNPDDPTGTKYMDVVSNAMPAFFHSMPNATLSLLRGLLMYTAPKTYDQIFEAVDRSQVIVVTGEEDNAFQPAPPTPWAGIDESGTVARNQERRTPAVQLPPATYVFSLSGDHDADLYVRVGSAPTTTSYDCRPAKSGSYETCMVTFTTTQTVHVLVRGYAASSTYRLVGSAQ